MSLTLLCLRYVGTPADPIVRAICLSNRFPITLRGFEGDGTLFLSLPVRARCEKAVFDQYTVVTTQHGHLGLKGGDSLITPLDDYPAILKGVVQNRIHVRMSTDSDLGGAPVFFSDAQITPCVCTVVVTPLFSNYSELPDVAAYIQSWQFQEAKNPDLALNPLSLDFARQPWK